MSVIIPDLNVIQLQVSAGREGWMSTSVWISSAMNYDGPLWRCMLLSCWLTTNT